MTDSLPEVRVSRKGEERLRSGHAWVFGDDLREVPAGLSPGQWAGCAHGRGNLSGRRRSTLGPGSPFDGCPGRMSCRRRRSSGTGCARRPRGAPRRGWAGNAPCGSSTPRAISSGVIADRYGDVLSVQILTAGMEIVRDLLLDVLERHFRPRLIYERSEGGGRRHEGLPERKGPARGEGSTREEIETDGVRFSVDVEAGPKTGFFLDQRRNRGIVRGLAEGKAVLDGFCAAGGFGLYALAGGAKSVLAIDSSRAAVETARANAALNGVSGQWEGEAEDLFQALRNLRDVGRRFDLVILDPPRSPSPGRGGRGRCADIGTSTGWGFRSSLPGASRHLVLHAVDRRDAMGRGPPGRGGRCRRRPREDRVGGAAADHPVLLSVPETDYLKFAVYRKRLP